MNRPKRDENKIDAYDTKNTAGDATSFLSNNPCADYHQASLKCLAKNDYDKTKCQAYFDAYKACLKEANAKKKSGLWSWGGSKA